MWWKGSVFYWENPSACGFGKWFEPRGISYLFGMNVLVTDVSTSWVVVIFGVKWRVVLRWWYLCLWCWFGLVSFVVMWLVVKTWKLPSLWQSLLHFTNTPLTFTILTYPWHCTHANCTLHTHPNNHALIHTRPRPEQWWHCFFPAPRHSWQGYGRKTNIS